MTRFLHKLATEDPKLLARLTDLLGAGFCFPSPEHYDMALEWASRAYEAGRADERNDPEGPIVTPELGALVVAALNGADPDETSAQERSRLILVDMAEFARVNRDDLRAERDRLADTLRRVRAIHVPTLGENGTQWCSVCSQDEEQPQPTGWWVPWPCPTIATLGDAGQLPDLGESGSNPGGAGSGWPDAKHATTDPED